MPTRRCILVATVGLLIALDAGRSLYARVASRIPQSLRVSNPDFAEPIKWPPASEAEAHAPGDKRLYLRHCAVCHGAEGRGNGPAAPSLHPRPRDFSHGVFKVKSTPGANPPTLADVRATIERGLPGSSMTGWHDILSGAEMDALADHVRTLGPHQAWAPPRDAPIVSEEIFRNSSAVAGRRWYDDLGCPACHGSQGRGDGGSAEALKDVWGQPDPARDLTAPWTFRAGDSPQAVYSVIAHGMSGTPMPGYAEVAEPGQIADVTPEYGSNKQPMIHKVWRCGLALAVGITLKDGRSA